MARRKRPVNETEEDTKIRIILETVSNVSSRSEKTSWNRKMDNMVKLITKLRPIEEQILQLNNDKMPIIDDINLLRTIMVKECVHPYEQLVYHENHVICKFCNYRLSIPNG